MRLGPNLVARGLLDPGDFRMVGEFALSVLRANPQLSWVSYGDRDDRFVGAWHDGAGQFYLNRSFPRGGRIRLEEDRVLPDGRRERVRTLDDHGYRPREQAFFRLAETSRDPVWTEPYRFYDGALGVTCAMALLDAAGRVRGVFTVDLSLDGLSRFVGNLRISPRGRVFIATADGMLVAAPGGIGGAGQAVREDSALVGEVVRRAGGGALASHTFERDGERYLGRAATLPIGTRQWITAVVVPERDYTAVIEAQAWRAAGLGLLALLAAIAGGIVLVRWIAAPLRELGDQARRIREGDLDVTIVPRSRDEIGTLARTMADMVQGLRDRDFIRDVLGRYVSPELAEQCVQDKNALRLGGELRTVSILMSDLRGFSGLSERLGPEKMIGLLNRYLGQMTPVILQHRGTINEFIGDAILVLFGAPFERPDDAERAVRCAAAMQRAMAGFNAESRAEGLPELVMGIAVHSGQVVAGQHRRQGPHEVRRGRSGGQPGGADRVAHRGTAGPPVRGDARPRAPPRARRPAEPGGGQGRGGAGDRVRAAGSGRRRGDGRVRRGRGAGRGRPAGGRARAGGEASRRDPASGPRHRHRPRCRGARRGPGPARDPLGPEAVRGLRRRRPEGRELRPRRRPRAWAGRHADARACSRRWRSRTGPASSGCSVPRPSAQVR